MRFKTKKDIPKRKTPFFFTLKSLSNKQQLFFYFICTLISVGSFDGIRRGRQEVGRRSSNAIVSSAYNCSTCKYR